MARHKAVTVKKPKRAGGSGGGGASSWHPVRAKSRANSSPHGRRSAGRPKGGYRFIDQPPSQDMKKKSPESAPRLYEWLVDGGFVEPVNTVSRRKGGSRTNRKRP